MSNTKWVAGRNMSGYMPDSEPMTFDTFDEAKRAVIEDIKNLEDEYGERAVNTTLEDSEEWEDKATELCHFAEDVNLERGEFNQPCLGQRYWVEKDHTK